MKTSLRRTLGMNIAALAIDEEEELKNVEKNDESSQSEDPFCEEEAKDEVAPTPIEPLLPVSEPPMTKSQSYNIEPKPEPWSLFSPNTSLAFKKHSLRKLHLQKSPIIESPFKPNPNTVPQKHKSRNKRLSHPSKTHSKSRSFRTSRRSKQISNSGNYASSVSPFDSKRPRNNDKTRGNDVKALLEKKRSISNLYTFRGSGKKEANRRRTGDRILVGNKSAGGQNLGTKSINNAIVKYIGMYRKMCCCKKVTDKLDEK